nr:DUF4150 domain-containing protein [Archangium primigenium]
MGNNAYANGRSISCKTGSGQVTAAFPDVCLSPPGPPAGPVPIPYPISSSASDMTSGSKTVLIGGKEAMLRDKSYFKKSTGDEAATKSFGQGVVNHQLSGKVYFLSWSMDVQFEGENVVRHLDMTTSNHEGTPGNEAVPVPQLESMTAADAARCSEVLARYPVESYKDQKGKTEGVHAGAQSHHVIQNAHFQVGRGSGKPSTVAGGCPNYTEDAAPCIPLKDGTDITTEHGWVSRMQKDRARSYRERYKESGMNVTYKEARQDAQAQLCAPDPGPGLTREEAECILIEVDRKFIEICGGTGNLELRPPGRRGEWKLSTPTPSSETDGGASGAF